MTQTQILIFNAACLITGFLLGYFVIGPLLKAAVDAVRRRNK